MLSCCSLQLASYGRTSDLKELNMSISTKEFKTIIAEEMREVAEREGLSLSKNADRGYAFENWTADLIFAAEDAYEGDPADAIQGSHDLGLDLLFEDSANKLLVICQCKYTTPQKPVSETDVTSFFNRHERYMDRRWVTKHGSEAVQELLLGYPDRVADGWNIVYRFITTGKATDKLHEIAEGETERYDAEDVSVRCEVLGFGELKNLYIRSLSLDETIPERVELNLPRDRFFEHLDPYPTLIAAISGNELRNLYNQYKQSLYAYNIRGYLGARGVNKAIGETAETEPEHFLYFNNGVSAICTDYQVLGDNRVVAKDFQIINGAQTVTSLARVEPSSAKVLFRLTKTLDVKTEKGINEKIIRFNNSQNSIKLSDFRANDPIQVFLERNLNTKRAHGPLPKFSYVRKRGTARKGRGTGSSIRLEELAKIRYSFLYEPTLISSQPRALWTLRDDGGVYEKSFGVEGTLQEAWSSSVLDETYLALAAYFTIVDDFRSRGKADPTYRYLFRLRFHALALIGEFAKREIAPELYGDLSTKTNTFNASFSDIWAPVRQMMSIAHSPVAQGHVTMYSLVRSSERWESMRDLFAEQLELRK